MDIYNLNPILDSIIYEVKFTHEKMVDCATYALIKNIFANIDEDGYNTSFLEHIDNHRKTKYDVH